MSHISDVMGVFIYLFNLNYLFKLWVNLFTQAFALYLYRVSSCVHPSLFPVHVIREKAQIIPDLDFSLFSLRMTLNYHQTSVWAVNLF